MQTKIEVVKTYWVGYTSDQREDLTKAIVKSQHNATRGPTADIEQLTPNEIEALDALRQALLNG